MIGYALLQLLLLLAYISPSWAQSEPAASPQQLLQQMVEAHRSQDYELLFLRPQGARLEAWRYRHAVINHQPVAQLLALEGPPNEVLLQDNTLSYFGQEKPPFSRLGGTIQAALPRLLQADFQRLQRFYDFTILSIDRVANRQCQVLRLAPRDPHRYGYLVWLDRQSKWLLRADWLETSGQPWEQFRVVALFQGGTALRQALQREVLNRHAPLPILTPPQTMITAWRPGWLPPGFTVAFSGQRLLPTRAEPVEVQLYSDGLWTVALYVHSVAPEMSAEPLLQERPCTVYSEIRQGWEVTVVGEIPLASARRIAQQVLFNPP